MIIGNHTFDTEKHTYVMGILNVTPDSFSDGGAHNELDAALRAAEQMILDGAAVIDVGGESTRPGHVQIGCEEEIARVLPVIEQLKRKFDIPVSIDTYKSEVAEAALRAGADMVNDIWGFRYDERIAEVTKKYHASCCLMHNREAADYRDFLEDVCRDLSASAGIALAAGIEKDRICLDPGVGFAKTQEQNLRVCANLANFKKLGYPMLLGTSRKSMIGNALDLPVDQREEGTLATSVMAAMNGYGFVRVHDVRANVRAIRMVEAIRAEEVR